jgi:hypothetical protein
MNHGVELLSPTAGETLAFLVRIDNRQAGVEKAASKPALEWNVGTRVITPTPWLTDDRDG